MKYLIFSDSHGFVLQMCDITRSEKPDKVLFLGDLTADADDLRRDCFNYSICSVKGNNDYGSEEQKELVLCDGKHKIFMTHGHIYNVKESTSLLVNAAKKRECDIALFGHTHVPFYEVIDGIHVINPGSVTYCKTYAVLQITEKGILAQIKTIP